MHFNSSSDSFDATFNPLEDKKNAHDLGCVFKKCCEKYKRKGKNCKKCPRK